MFGTSPTAGMPSARAMMATWLGRPAVLQHQAAQIGALVVEQRRPGPCCGRREWRCPGSAPPWGGSHAGELLQQAIGEIVEIVQPLAQIRIGLALQFGAGVVLHALDRRFRRQAGIQRLAQAPHPAAIVGEHAHGFEHVAVFAGAVAVAARDQHCRSGRAWPGSPRRAARSPRSKLFGDQLLDDDARLVQHDMAEADAVGERRALQRHRLLQAQALAGLRPATATRPTRSSRPAAWRWSGAPRLPLPNRCAARGSARRARRACCRRAGSARRGRIDRFLRPSPDDS